MNVLAIVGHRHLLNAYINASAYPMSLSIPMYLFAIYALVNWRYMYAELHCISDSVVAIHTRQQTKMLYSVFDKYTSLALITLWILCEWNVWICVKRKELLLASLYRRNETRRKKIELFVFATQPKLCASAYSSVAVVFSDAKCVTSTSSGRLTNAHSDIRGTLFMYPCAPPHNCLHVSRLINNEHKTRYALN